VSAQHPAQKLLHPLLRVFPDPNAAKVLAQCRGVVGEAIEALASRGLAPIEWTEPEWAERHNEQALLIALRNPRALVDAEALLREGLVGTRGEYIGLRSWDQLCALNYGTESGGHLPSICVAGFHNMRSDHIAQWWLNATRDSGSSHGYPGALVWRCADQILAGPPWVSTLYRTGLGLWCWDTKWGAPQWALLARDGDGLPWPMPDPEQKW
jgi:hypothetical protein